MEKRSGRKKTWKWKREKKHAFTKIVVIALPAPVSFKKKNVDVDLYLNKMKPDGQLEPWNAPVGKDFIIYRFWLPWAPLRVRLKANPQQMEGHHEW